MTKQIVHVDAETHTLLRTLVEEIEQRDQLMLAALEVFERAPAILRALVVAVDEFHAKVAALEQSLAELRTVAEANQRATAAVRDEVLKA
jgi:DNA-directed RNA polymerase subunit L